MKGFGMRSFARGAALLVLGVLFLSSVLFAQSLTVRVGRGNVRSGPGDTYEVIGKVRRGQKCDVEARQGDWFKILLETGQEGWVFKSLVEVSGKRSIGVVPSGPAISASRPYGDSWALVVGINRYRKPSLRLSYAVNDARAVVSALRKIGFAQNRITLLEDGQATGLAVRRGFDHLRLNTKPEDRVFIFFAGHGTTVDIPGGGQMGYLIPVDGTVEALLATGIPMNQVRNMARLIPAKHVFFAIDACFAGLMAARETPKPYKAETVSRLTRGRLRQILTAGDRDQRAWEEAGHGLFTRRLLEGLDGEADVSPRDGVLTAMELAAYVQGQVTAITQGKQTPIFAKMEGVGQFVFTAPGLGGQPRAEDELARMRAKLEAERRKLEAEKTGLERQRLEAERKKLEAERKRIAALRKSVGAGLRPGPPPRPPKPPRVAVGPGTPHQIGSGLDAMVYVPAGGFTMGSNSGDKNEEPRRRVYLDTFYIDKYPVTNARFRRFGEPKEDYGSKYYGARPLTGARQPVVGVTWYQARDYCKSMGKRLPTEAEWEKAARGVEGRLYPWGGQWEGSNVIWRKNSGKKTHPVDRTYNTHRSPFGAVDMAGNVWEWIQDWFKADYYGTAPARNPKGPTSGTKRVIRGGAWFVNAPARNPKGPTSGTKRVIRGGAWFVNAPLRFRAAYRYWAHPDGRWDSGGFRCAKAP